MAHLGGFDNYLKDSTLDLSSIESNRQVKKTETPVDNVIVIISYNNLLPNNY